MVCFKSAAFAAVVFCVLVGCGGGSTGSGGFGLTTVRVGEASVTSDGTVKPFIGQGSGNVTVTGMAGTAYANVSIIPNKTLDNTLIAYYTGGAIWTTPPGGGTPNEITTEGIYGQYAAFTHDGHIIFTSYTVSAQSYFLYECNYDGSNAVKLFNTAVNPTLGADWSPNNQKIAWVDLTGKLWVSNPNGTGAVMISSAGAYPQFSPDSQTIAFESTSGAHPQIYTAPAAGGAATILPGQGASNNSGYPSWLVDGQSLIFSINTGTASTLYDSDLSGGFLFSIVPGSGTTDDEQPTVAPDGKTIAFLRGQYNHDLAIVTSQFSGIGASTLVPLNGYPIDYPRWSPYPGPVTYVGSSGTMFSSAAGFLWGQNGDVFSSLLSFTASTPNSATITPQTDGTGGQLVYDIHAASLTGLKYTNCYYGQTITVIPGASSAQTDALVSFDPTTGQVGTIAPFIASRTAKPVRQGGSLVYEGHFSGVWDGKGHNMAPQGASRVSIDTKTGAATVG